MNCRFFLKTIHQWDEPMWCKWKKLNSYSYSYFAFHMVLQTLVVHSILIEPPFNRSSFWGTTRQVLRQLPAAIWLWWLNTFGSWNRLFFTTNLAADCTKFEPLNAQILFATQNLGSQPPTLFEISCQICEKKHISPTIKKNSRQT